MAVTTHRNTALHFAVSSDCAELAEMLLQDVVVKAHIDEVNAVRFSIQLPLNHADLSYSVGNIY